MKSDINDSITENSTDALPLWSKDDALNRVMGNEAILTKVCTMFVNAMPDKIASLEHAANSNDLQQIIEISHSLKGLAANIGAMRLSDSMSHLEHVAKHQQSHLITDLHTHASQQMQETLAVLNHYLDTHN